jgi:hypothetical protein
MGKKLIPKPPHGRRIKEGTIGDCPICHSTTIKKYRWFGKSLGCIQPACPNFFIKKNK